MYYSTPLRIARARRGYSLAKLAKQTGISAQALSLYEKRAPSLPFRLKANFMERLVQALGYPVTFFQLDDLPQLAQSAVSFNTKKCSAIKRDRALAAGQLAIEIGTWLSDQFSLPVPRFQLFEDGYADDPDLASYTLRTESAIGQLAIRNMVHFIESKGVRVFSLPADCVSVGSFSFWQDNVPYLLLDTAGSPEQIRFDAAYQMGSLLLPRHGDNRDHEQNTLFALSLLMPQEYLISTLRRNPSLSFLIELKQHWGVSLMSIIQRANGLGFSTPEHHQSLLGALISKKNNKEEKEISGMTTAGESSLILRKLGKFVREESLSKSHHLSWPANDLCWPIDETRALTFGLLPSFALLRGHSV